MKKLEEGVLLTHEEYTEYQKTLKALAALRNVTSFQNSEVEP